MKVGFKRSLRYLTYTFGFIILLILISKVNFHFDNMYKETFSFYPWNILTILMYLPIGIYLGLPKFLKEFNKTGKWRINPYKVVFVGLPMLYLAFYWYFPFSYPIPDVLIYTNSVFKLGTIIVGFRGTVLLLRNKQENRPFVFF